MGEFRDNASARRFEWEEDGFVSVCEYRIDADGRRALLHVETPAPARGRGAAARLMNAIVEEARRRGYKLVPVCSYAVAHLRRHTATRDVQA